MTKKHRKLYDRNRKKEAWEFIKSFKNYGCQIKGCNEDSPHVLDFHHLEPDKKDWNIGDLYRRRATLEKVFDEILKCVVICANCHRKVHAGIIKT